MTTLKYYWIVTYTDGSRFAQYNPDGSENMWKEVQQDDVVKVAWKQFSITLSNKIEIPTKWVLFLSEYSLDFGPEDKIFIVRRNHINFSPSGEDKGRRIEYILGKNGEELIEL